MATRGPSLQGFQDLDKDVPDFEGQLQHLRELAYLGSSSSDSGGSLEQNNIHRFHGRDERAIRWLLRKLLSTEVDGSHARLSPKSWKTLADLILSTPPRLAAKALAASDVLGSLEKGLNEAFGLKCLFSVSNGEVQINTTTLDSVVWSARNVEASEENQNSSLGKRKREKILQSESKGGRQAKLSQKNNAISTPEKPNTDPLELFLAITDSLCSIKELSRRIRNLDSALNPTNSRSLLSTGSEQSAMILGAWLNALCTHGRQDLSQQNDESTQYERGLEAVLDIWGSRISEPLTHSEETNKSFSRYCLLPIAILLGRNDDEMLKSNIEKIDVKGVLQRLVAKHIFMAAKPVFLENSLESDAIKSKGSADTSVNLSDLLQPIRSALELDNSEAVQEKLCLDSLRQSISTLLSVAIKCTSCTTPRRRLAESPWLEYIFVELAACLGINLNGDDVRQVEPERLLQFNKMLEIAKKNKLKLNLSLLRRIATRCGKLSPSDEIEPNWTAIGHLVSLDANIFLRESRSSTAELSGSRTSLAAMLFTALSRRVVMVRAETTFKEAGSNFSNSNAFPTVSQYENIRDDIVIPLIRAYAAGRDVKMFLQHWHSGIIESSQKLYPYRIMSIWDDTQLRKTLTDLLESSLTSTQIAELVNERRLDFEPERKINSDQIGASSGLLAAILDSITRDETKSLVVETSGTILKNTLNIVCSKQMKPSAHRRRLWSLIASSHRLWSSINQDGLNAKSTIHDKVIGGALCSALETFSQRDFDNLSDMSKVDFGELEDCLLSVGSILNDNCYRKWEYSSVAQPLYQILLGIESASTKKNSFAFDTKTRLFQSVAVYPEILHFVNDQLGFGAIREFLAVFLFNSVEVWDEINKQTSPWTETPWTILVSRSLEDCTWLLEHIITMLERWQNESMLNIPDDISFERGDELVALSYLQISPGCLSRKERKRLLVKCMDESPKHISSYDEWCAHLSLLIHQMNPISGLNGPAVPFWNIIGKMTKSLGSLPSNFSAEAEVLTLFARLVKLALSRDMEVAGSAKAEDCLINAIERALAIDDLNPGHVTVLTAAFDLLAAMDKGNDSELSMRVAAVQDRACERVIDSISDKRSIRLESDNPERLESSVFFLEGVAKSLTKIHERVLQKHQFAVHSVVTIGESALKMAKNMELHQSKLASRLAVYCYQLNWKSSSLDPESLDLAAACGLLQSGLNAEGQAILQDFLLEVFARLPEQSRTDKVQDLLSDGQQEASADISSSRWALLQTFICGFETKTTPNRQDIIPDSEVPNLMLALAANLQKADSIRTFHHTASSIAHLLRHNTKSATFPTIESILLNITTVACSLPNADTRAIPSGHGPRIFTHLTSLLRVLLTQHRHRLRGRFDLVVGALQSLLRHFFAPVSASTHGPREDASPTPSSWPLTRAHADAFTRVVTQLCDPSVSATTTARRRERGALTDETRKARAYAGQHVGPLLLTLCEMQLRGGRFVAEGVRDALAEGVYAMFDAMGKDVLAATNEGVGVSAGLRTVLRQWWDEWRRERKSD